MPGALFYHHDYHLVITPCVVSRSTRTDARYPLLYAHASYDCALYVRATRL